MDKQSSITKLQMKPHNFLGRPIMGIGEIRGGINPQFGEIQFYGMGNDPSQISSKPF
jgi:hypothetical protein